MARFLYNLILMSISGSVMYMLAVMVRKLTGNRFVSWYYYLLITSAALLIVPLQAVFTIPKIVNIEISNNFNRIINSTSGAVKQASISPITVIFIVWALISAVFVVFTVLKYVRSYRNLKAIGEKAYDERVLSAYTEMRSLLRLKGDIGIMTSGALTSPLLFGVIKPVIVIPEREFTYDELKMIFAHELMHYKHKDLLIKLAMSLAMSVHWFNPLVYILAKSMNECCEFCCDECVLKTMNLTDKKDYGRLLISVIEHTGKRSYAYTTAAASPKSDIQKRLTRIAEFKNTSGAFKAAGAMLAVSMTVCSVTAFGFDRAKEVLPEPVAEFIEEAVTSSVVTQPSVSEENSGYIEHGTKSSDSAYEENIINSTDKALYENEAKAEINVGASYEAGLNSSAELPGEQADDAEDNGVINLTEESDMMSIHYEEGTRYQSPSSFSAPYGTDMVVTAEGGIRIQIVNAVTGEIVHEQDMSENSGSITMPSGKYSINTFSDRGEKNAVVYVYGKESE